MFPLGTPPTSKHGRKRQGLPKWGPLWTRSAEALRRGMSVKVRKDQWQTGAQMPLTNRDSVQEGDVFRPANVGRQMDGNHGQIAPFYKHKAPTLLNHRVGGGDSPRSRQRIWRPNQLGPQLPVTHRECCTARPPSPGRSPAPPGSGTLSPSGSGWGYTGEAVAVYFFFFHVCRGRLRLHFLLQAVPLNMVEMPGHVARPCQCYIDFVKYAWELTN